MGKNTNESQVIVLYNSIIDAASNLDAKYAWECILKIRDYALYGKDGKSENWGVNLVLDVAKPLLDGARKRYEKCVENGNKGKEFGKNGGRPKKATKPQEKPQSEPLNVYVNANANDNLNIKEKVYQNPYGYLKENDSHSEKGDVVSGQDSTINKESVDDITNQNQSRYEKHLQVEDDFISSPETKDNHIGNSNSCSSVQESKEYDDFMDTLFEFQGLDDCDGLDRNNPLYSKYTDLLSTPPNS